MVEAFHKQYRALFVFLFAVVLIAIAASIYFFAQYQRSQQLLKNPTLAAHMEIEDLVSRVGKLIDLPTEEVPTVATVSDYTKLQDQPFFAHAKNGDKVLIFTKAKEAILYDPVANKIIAVAPVNIGATPSPAALRIALYTSGATSSAAATVEQELHSKSSQLSIVTKTSAKGTYTKNLIVDLTGQNASSVQQLAALLDGEVSTLPTGELKPTNADILVIVGSAQ